MIRGQAFNGKSALWSKSLVNAAMMKHKYNARSPHVPYEEFDSHARAGVRIVEGWPFRVHHYTGSMKPLPRDQSGLLKCTNKEIG
eukprot:scaffold9079_cov120-Cylindrotheca_fusiformis.AAC.12